MEKFNFAVLTASDKGARGEREDISSRVIIEMVAGIGGETVAYDLVPDDFAALQDKLLHYTDHLRVDLVVTTGGTGLSPRDNTPEATLSVIEKQVPGMAEAMRQQGLLKTPHAMLSRSVCGVRGKTLIVNLPGSPRAVQENLSVILPALPHALSVLCGLAKECADVEKNTHK